MTDETPVKPKQLIAEEVKRLHYLLKNPEMSDDVRLKVLGQLQKITKQLSK